MHRLYDIKSLSIHSGYLQLIRHPQRCNLGNKIRTSCLQALNSEPPIPGGATLTPTPVDQGQRGQGQTIEGQSSPSTPVSKDRRHGYLDLARLWLHVSPCFYGTMTPTSRRYHVTSSVTSHVLSRLSSPHAVNFRS